MSTTPTPLDGRRYDLLLAVYEQLTGTHWENDLLQLLPEGADSITTGDPDSEWTGNTDALLVIRPFSGDTRSTIGGEVPTYDVQVVLEWSFEYHDTSQTFWHAEVFDAVDDGLNQFSPGQFTGLGSNGGIDAQPDSNRNRYLADAVYSFRTRL